MSKTGRHIFKRKRKSSVTFHVDEDFSKGWRKRAAGRRLGLARTLGTAASLVTALSAAFVAMHYLPATLSPSQVLRVSDVDQQALRERPDGAMAWIAPYWSSIQTRRSYLWDGEAVDVRYSVPEGQSVDLVVQQCARQWVVEVFRCRVVSQQRLTVNGAHGQKRLYVGSEGFYRFREIGPAGHQVIWRRA